MTDKPIPAVYDECGIEAAPHGVLRQMIEDTKKSPFGEVKFISTPQDTPNPYHKHLNDSLEFQAQAEMSQHGAISVAELPEMLQEAMKQAAVSGDAKQPVTPQRYGPIAGYPTVHTIPMQQALWPDMPWNSPVVSCPRCGGLCTHVLLSLDAKDSDVVFRCVPCYEKHHGKKSVPDSPVELNHGSSVPVSESGSTPRNQSPAWNVAPWVEPLSYAGTYSPTD